MKRIRGIQSNLWVVFNKEARMRDVVQNKTEQLVSVIVPVYNCEKYIQKCLKSILHQSYKEIEVLVVNDGSTDNSQRIINNIAKSDRRILSLNQINRGVAAARNYALSFAKGEYYLFVDGDDYIGIDYIWDLVDCAKRNRAELVICGHTLVHANKTTLVIPGKYIKHKKEEWAYRLSSVCSRLYNSDFWNRNNLHFIMEKGARAEDVPIALFANVMAENLQIIDKADYFYVQHDGSAMNSKKNVLFLFPYYSFTEMYQKVSNLELNNSRAFFDMGVLKFLAQFEFVIYRKVGKEEKRKFHDYVCWLLDKDKQRMSNEWSLLKKNIELPRTHKFAISLFVRLILLKQIKEK